MNWPEQDNKKYRGKIDRIYVSRTEWYEVDYAIDEYLRTRNYVINDANRKVMHGWLDAYPGPVPVLRTALQAWLDANVTRVA